MRAVGIAFKNFRSGKFLRAILESLNKFLSYAEFGRQSQILKALSERRGNRFQKFAARKIFVCDFIISKQTPFV